MIDMKKIAQPGIGKSITQKDGERYGLSRLARPKQKQAEQSGPSYRELKAKVEALEKSSNALQSTQEIKYLKGQIASLKKDSVGKRCAVINLSDALRKLGVPGEAINKLIANEPVTANDAGESFKALIAPVSSEE